MMIEACDSVIVPILRLAELYVLADTTFHPLPTKEKPPVKGVSLSSIEQSNKYYNMYCCIKSCDSVYYFRVF